MRTTKVSRTHDLVNRKNARDKYKHTHVTSVPPFLCPVVTHARVVVFVLQTKVSQLPNWRRYFFNSVDRRFHVIDLGALIYVENSCMLVIMSARNLHLYC